MPDTTELVTSTHSGSYFVAVRPSRFQLAIARLVVFLYGGEGRVPFCILSFIIGALASISVIEFAKMIFEHGARFALEVALGRTLFVAAVAISALAALGALFAGERTLLDRAEISGGVLLGIGPEQLCCTVNGATVVSDWKHVEIFECSLGFIFQTPWRAFHLLPRAALSPSALSSVTSILQLARAKRAQRDLIPYSAPR